jgi:hypothetical protein
LQRDQVLAPNLSEIERFQVIPVDLKTVDAFERDDYIVELNLENFQQLKNSEELIGQENLKENSRDIYTIS